MPFANFDAVFVDAKELGNCCKLTYDEICGKYLETVILGELI